MSVTTVLPLTVHTDEFVPVDGLSLPLTHHTHLHWLLLDLLGLLVDPLLLEEGVQHPCAPESGDPAAWTRGEGG